MGSELRKSLLSFFNLTSGGGLLLFTDQTNRNTMRGELIMDRVLDQIAEARYSIQVPKVQLDEKSATFDVRFKLTIDRELYDLTDTSVEEKARCDQFAG